MQNARPPVPPPDRRVPRTQQIDPAFHGQHADGRHGRFNQPRRGRVGRFFRGYLMLVGALTTIAALVLLLVRLFVEIEKWTTI